MVTNLWKIGYVLGAFVTPICFQMVACACSPCVIAACRMSTNWTHTQYQSSIELESLHYSLPIGWILSLQGKFYWCSETLTHKGNNHHSVMFVPFLFLQNSLVFFLGWLCGFSLEEYNIHSLPSTSPIALPNSKRGQKAFSNILLKDGVTLN